MTSFYECEHRLKTKSGDWRWVLARGKVVERDNDGNPLRHTGTQFDINDRVIAQEALKEARDALEQKVAKRTAELVNANELLKQKIKERKQADKALRESEERFRALLEGTASCIFFIEDRVMKYVNPAALKTFDYTKEEMIGNDTSLPKSTT